MAQQEVLPTESAVAPEQQTAPTTSGSPMWRILIPVLALGVIGSAIFVLTPARPGTGTTSGTEGVATGAPAVPRTGAPAPDFQTVSLEGKPVSLRDYRGQTVLVNFWATWCIPCRTEMPDLGGAYLDRKDRGFVVLGVNVKESEAEARRFLDEVPVPFPVLMDPDGDVTTRYAVTALPSSFFVDEEGIIRGVFVGTLNQSAVLKKLDQMAANRAADQAEGAKRN